MKRAGMGFVGACACTVLTACGGGGADESSDTVVSTTEVVATTTDASTTTSVLETTTAPTTTSSTPSTTSTTTTLAPTTTLSEEQAAIAAAEAALVAAVDARVSALEDPTGADQRQLLAEFWTDSGLAAVLKQVDQFATNGYRASRSEEPPSKTTVMEGSLVGNDVVRVTYCRLDADAVVLQEKVGGLEVVIDDDVITRIWTANMVNDGTGWRFESATIDAERDGDVPCADLL